MTTRSSTVFDPLTASLFVPRDVQVEERIQISYAKTLGRSSDVNATSAFIQALALAGARNIYAVRDIRI